MQPLAKDALTALAAQRSSAILSHLKTTAGLEEARIGSKAAAEVKADKPAEIATALTLDAGK